MKNNLPKRVNENQRLYNYFLMSKSDFYLLAIVGCFDTAHTLSRNGQALVNKDFHVIHTVFSPYLSQQVLNRQIGSPKSSEFQKNISRGKN